MISLEPTRETLLWSIRLFWIFQSLILATCVSSKQTSRSISLSMTWSSSLTDNSVISRSHLSWKVNKHSPISAREIPSVYDRFWWICLETIIVLICSIASIQWLVLHNWRHNCYLLLIRLLRLVHTSINLKTYVWIVLLVNFGIIKAFYIYILILSIKTIIWIVLLFYHIIIKINLVLIVGHILFFALVNII